MFDSGKMDMPKDIGEPSVGGDFDIPELPKDFDMSEIPKELQLSVEPKNFDVVTGVDNDDTFDIPEGIDLDDFDEDLDIIDMLEEAEILDGILEEELNGLDINDPTHFEELKGNTGLTEKEIDDSQKEKIGQVLSGEKKLETNEQKGNFGEMAVDQDLKNRGYNRVSNDVVTTLEEGGHQGIDGVYENPDGDPRYIIVDAKYESSKLSETADGKQMSAEWIDKRLDESVGKEKADEIRATQLENPDSVGTYVGHVNSEGNVTYSKLDAEANVTEKDVKIGE